MTVALDAGAEDMKSEPDESNYEIITAPQDFEAVKKGLQDKGVKFESAEVTMIPQTYVKLEGKEAEQMVRLMDALEDNDDVQNVYANFDIPDDVMEKIA